MHVGFTQHEIFCMKNKVFCLIYTKMCIAIHSKENTEVMNVPLLIGPGTEYVHIIM